MILLSHQGFSNATIRVIHPSQFCTAAAAVALKPASYVATPVVACFHASPGYLHPFEHFHKRLATVPCYQFWPWYVDVSLETLTTLRTTTPIVYLWVTLSLIISTAVDFLPDYFLAFTTVFTVVLCPCCAFRFSRNSFITRAEVKLKIQVHVKP